MPRIVNLPTKSSILRRTMAIDLAPIAQYRNFWQKDQRKEGVWQALSDHYINKPYLDDPFGYNNITHQGFTIYHRNHDVTHAARQRIYAKKYLDIIGDYGKSPYGVVAKYIKDNSEVRACLELAVFLCRSGRTNERTGRDDDSNAKRSAELFKEVASELGFNKSLIDFMQFAVATHAPKLENNPLVANLPGEHTLELAKLLKGVLELSHDTDLVRCRTGISPHDTVRQNLERELSNFVDSSKLNIKRTTTNLLLYAIQACKMTGTRVRFQAFFNHDKANNPALKAKHSKNVIASMRELDQIRLDLHKISHEGMDGDFDELLRQLPLTTQLDLTNWKITPEKFDRIKMCVENTPLITKACVLGITPGEMQKQLVNLLEEKSKQQQQPIKILYADEFDQQSTNSFERQLRQQAVNKQKISMRFEPSRLAHASKQGITATFNQLQKEIVGNVPKFGGENDYLKINSVKKLFNPARLQIPSATPIISQKYFLNSN